MLSWSDLNPNTSIRHTTRKFYNQYLNKIVVYCPGARVVYDRHSHINLDQVIDTRVQRMEYLQRLNRWSYRYDTKEWDRNQLAELVTINRTAKQSGIKIRIEEPYVSVYGNDQEFLYSIGLILGANRLKEIFLPENDSAVTILNRGEIIIKTDMEFSYKILLRENWGLAAESKRSLLDYLYNLGDDEVCLTKSLVRNLGDNTRNWFPGGYFYARDEKITTFINLIAPGIISGIFRLSKLDQ